MSVQAAAEFYICDSNNWNSIFVTQIIELGMTLVWQEAKVMPEVDDSLVTNIGLEPSVAMC